MNLPAYIYRCHGASAEHVCQTCARREQIGRDDPRYWYFYMNTQPKSGQCVWRIEEKALA